MTITSGPKYRHRCPGSVTKNYRVPKRPSWAGVNWEPPGVFCNVCNDLVKLRKDGKIGVHHEIRSDVYITGHGFGRFIG